MTGEIEELYSDRSGSIHSVRADPDEMRPPHGAFLIVLEEGRAVGCGGLKRFDEETCEIKRMYLAPDARGGGLSRRLLEALERRASELGYSRVRLDTGDRQPAARHLYESSGYVEIPRYNQNTRATLWYEKAL